MSTTAPRQEDGGGRSAAPAQTTLLVAGGERVVRALMARLLRLRGYRVIEAASGAEAMAAVGEDGGIDLLITDVVVGDMTGRELADRVAAARPGVPVLYISGQADQELAAPGGLAPGLRLLQRPIRAEVLAQRVRELLAERR